LKLQRNLRPSRFRQTKYGHQLDAREDMDLHLKGKTVLITGGSRGIGAAAARSFAKEGCSVRLVARDAKALESVCEEIRALYGTEASAIPLDIGDAAAIRDIASAHSDIDILVNNVGEPPPVGSSDTDGGILQDALSVEVSGSISLALQVYSSMKNRGHGVIVNTVGVAGEHPDVNSVTDSVSNAGLMAFTTSVGGKSIADNIRVVGINPGQVNTERFRQTRNAALEKQFGAAPGLSMMLAHTSPQRISQPQEIADIIVFAASDRCTSVSGSIITVGSGSRAG
jgi:NAD(P)-dependent dehydrogenase (short-subunit alcohol dehydrogenase family)